MDRSPSARSKSPLEARTVAARVHFPAAWAELKRAGVATKSRRDSSIAVKEQ